MSEVNITENVITSAVSVSGICDIDSPANSSKVHTIEILFINHSDTLDDFNFMFKDQRIDACLFTLED